MGEAKRREAINAATRLLASGMLRRGLLIEAGWQTMRAHFLPKDMSPEEENRARDLFFSGAQHLFFSLMQGLDAGNDATRDDMNKMRRLDSELETFTEDFCRRHPNAADIHREMRRGPTQ